MTERPIIFSAPMVQAILAGRKTQTRRVLKNVPPMPEPACAPHHTPRHAAPYLDAYCGEKKTAENPRGMSSHWCWWQVDDRPCATFPIRFAPGDLLWVREAFGWVSAHGVQYRANNKDLSDYYEDGSMGRWKPSIHMPRWASRLTLLVTEVRVQRLQGINEEDAKAEGLATVTKDGKFWKWGIPDRDGLPGTDDVGWPWVDWCRDPRDAYRKIWESLHGPGSWDANPWVAAISFEVAR